MMSRLQSPKGHSRGMHAFLSIHSKQWAPALKSGGDEFPKPRARKRGLGKETKKQQKKHSTTSTSPLVLVSSSSELMSASCCVLYPKPLLPIAVCNYYKQKGREKEHEHDQSKYVALNSTLANEFLACMPRHFWAWPSLFFFRQEMKLMRNGKGLRYDVVLCLHCSSLKFFKGVQKTKGYTGVVAGKQRETGFWKQGRTARPQEVSLSLSHTETRAKKLSCCLPGTLLIHMFFFFSPHPNN